MTEQLVNARIPDLTLGWRLKMSLGNVTAGDMADALGVNRATISRWCADKGAPPKRAYLAQWSLITQTDRAWLETGIAPTDNGGGDTVSGRRDSNSQHSAWNIESSGTVVRPLFGARGDLTEEQAA